MRFISDDLGTDVELDDRPRRIVSLVPSLTESIASVDPGALIAATEWCTHPADLDVPRVRGTKNPDLAAIRALEPDLVVANKEENRELDVRRLRDSGVPVWVTDIETVDAALRSLRRLLVDVLRWDVPAWLTEAERSWSAPPPEPRRRVAVPIWRDPWMVVGSPTFTGDVLDRLGLDNIGADAPFSDDGRYPHATVEQIVAAAPDLVLLPDEPYVFTATDGPDAFPGLSTVLVSGRLLTWYGPSLATARDELLAAIRN